MELEREVFGGLRHRTEPDVGFPTAAELAEANLYQVEQDEHDGRGDDPAGYLQYLYSFYQPSVSSHVRCW